MTAQSRYDPGTVPIALPGQVVLSGNAGSLPRFLSANPLSLTYLGLIGLCLGCGVFCYTLMIERAGSVAAVAVSTCRKVASAYWPSDPPYRTSF